MQLHLLMEKTLKDSSMIDNAKPDHESTLRAENLKLAKQLLTDLNRSPEEIQELDDALHDGLTLDVIPRTDNSIKKLEDKLFHAGQILQKPFVNEPNWLKAARNTVVFVIDYSSPEQEVERLCRINSTVEDVADDIVDRRIKKQHKIRRGTKLYRQLYSEWIGEAKPEATRMMAAWVEGLMRQLESLMRDQVVPRADAALEVANMLDRWMEQYRSHGGDKPIEQCRQVAEQIRQRADQYRSRYESAVNTKLEDLQRQLADLALDPQPEPLPVQPQSEAAIATPYLIGDLVRIVAVQPHQSKDWIGQTGTIAKIGKPGTSQRIRVVVEGKGGQSIELPLPPTCIEPVKGEQAVEATQEVIGSGDESKPDRNLTEPQLLTHPHLISEDPTHKGLQRVRVTSLETSQALAQRQYQFGNPQFCWIGYGPSAANYKHGDWKPGDIEDALKDETAFFHPPDFVYSLRDESLRPPWLFVNLAAWAYTEAEIEAFGVDLDGIEIVMVEVPPSNWKVNQRDTPEDCDFPTANDEAILTRGNMVRPTGCQVSSLLHRTLSPQQRSTLYRYLLNMLAAKRTEDRWHDAELEGIYADPQTQVAYFVVNGIADYDGKPITVAVDTLGRQQDSWAMKAVPDSAVPIAAIAVYPEQPVDTDIEMGLGWYRVSYHYGSNQTSAHWVGGVVTESIATAMHAAFPQRVKISDDAKHPGFTIQFDGIRNPEEVAAEIDAVFRGLKSSETLTPEEYYRRLGHRPIEQRNLPSCVVNVKHDEYDTYIGRANIRYRLPQSKWHNPYVVGKDGNLVEVLQKFEAHLLANDELMAALHELDGKRLGCWCAKKGQALTADDPIRCHGQILLKARRGDYRQSTPPPTQYAEIKTLQPLHGLCFLPVGAAQYCDRPAPGITLLVGDRVLVHDVVAPDRPGIIKGFIDDAEFEGRQGSPDLILVELLDGSHVIQPAAWVEPLEPERTYRGIKTGDRVQLTLRPSHVDPGEFEQWRQRIVQRVNWFDGTFTLQVPDHPEYSLQHYPFYWVEPLPPSRFIPGVHDNGWGIEVSPEAIESIAEPPETPLAQPVQLKLFDFQ